MKHILELLMKGTRKDPTSQRLCVRIPAFKPEFFQGFFSRLLRGSFFYLMIRLFFAQFRDPSDCKKLTLNWKKKGTLNRNVTPTRNLTSITTHILGQNEENTHVNQQRNPVYLINDVHAGCWGDPLSSVNSTVYEDQWLGNIVIGADLNITLTQ